MLVWLFHLQPDWKGWLTLGIYILILAYILRWEYIQERRITKNKAAMRIKVFLFITLWLTLYGPLLIIGSRHDVLEIIIGSIGTIVGIVSTPILIIKLRRLEREECQPK